MVSKEYAARLKALGAAYGKSNAGTGGAVAAAVKAGKSGPVTGGSSTSGFTGDYFKPQTAVAAPKASSGKSTFGQNGRAAAGANSAGAKKQQESITKKALDAITSDDSAGAPQNAGQYILNLLSSANYAIGDAIKQSGSSERMAAQKDATKNIDYKAGNLAEQIQKANPEQSFGKQVESLKGAGVGAAQGLGEGVLGQRYDKDGDGTKEKPTLISGAMEAGKQYEGLGKKGKFAAELGTDIFTDPSTYLTLGTTGLIKGAVKGGAEAARVTDAARIAAGAEQAGSKVGNVIKGSAKGAIQGRRAAVLKETERLAARAEGKALRRDRKLTLRAGVAAAKTEAKRADLPEVERIRGIFNERIARTTSQVGARDLAAERDAIITRLTGAVDDAAPQVDNAVDNASDAVPSLDELTQNAFREPVAAPTAAVDDVVRQVADAGTDASRISDEVAKTLPRLTTKATSRAIPVDGRAILADAAKAEGSAAISEAQVGAISSVLQMSKVKDIEAGVAALKKDKDLAGILASKPKLKGMEDLTVAQLIHRAAMLRATGAAVGEASEASRKLGAIQQTIDTVLARGSAVRRTTTPQSLADAIANAIPSLKTPTNADELFERLKTTPPQDRAKLIEDSFQASEKIAGTRGFATAEDAFAAAERGELTATSAREMLRALGQDPATVKAIAPADVNSVLAGSKKTWDDVVSSLATPAEVAANHGVPEDVVRAADSIDVDAAVAQAAEDSTARVVDEVGYDATKTDVDFGDRVGNAIGAGVKHLGAMLVRDGDKSGAFDNQTTYEVFAKVMQKVSASAKGKAENGLVASTDRMENGLRAMSQIEDYARGVGMTPRFMDAREGLGGPLHVSLTQIARALDPETTRALLFPTKIGTKDVVRGTTIYPTVIGNAFRLGAHLEAGGAERAQVVEEIGAFLSRELTVKGASAYMKSPEGAAAVKRMLDEIRDTDVLTNIRALHDAQAPVAQAIAKSTARKIVSPATAKLLSEFAKVGDRGKMQDVIDKVMASTAKAATPVQAGGDDLVSDMVKQQMNSGLIEGILGSDAQVLIRSDARTAARQAATEAKQAERAAATLARRSRGKAKRPDAAAAASERGQAAADARAAADDAEDDLRDAVQRDIDEGNVDPTDDAQVITSYAEHLSMLPTFQRNARITSLKLSGYAGVGSELRHLVASGEIASKQESAAYAEAITTWLKGKSFNGAQRAAAGTRKLEGVDVRLARVMGLNRKADRYQIASKMGEYWTALAKIEPGSSEGQIAAELGRAGYAAGEVQLITELKGMIDYVFSPGVRGGLARTGMTGEDLLKHMKSLGFGARGHEMENFLPAPGETLADQAEIWRDFTFDGGLNPLDTLERYQQALSGAQTMKNIGAHLSKNFDHRSTFVDGTRMTAADARAAGWFRVDTKAENADLARFIDPESYFPPELKQQMTFLEKIARESSAFKPGPVKNIVGVYDAIMRVFKSSATIWRVGHHVANLLGDMMANSLRGVTPFQYIRSIRAAHAGGHMFDADITHMQSLQGYLPEGQQVAKKLSGDKVFINVGGKLEEVNLNDVWTAGLQNGALMNANSARDLVDDVGTRATGPTGLAAAFRMTGLPQIDEKLGQFSAVRDNLTRMAHYLQELEDGSFGSVEEALQKASGIIQEYHPTIESLSTFERKYARRVFYFYTWMRQTTDLIVRTALDKPGIVTIPSKAQYDLADVNGLNPESIGQIYNGDERVASYGQNSLLGPSFLRGDNLTQDFDPDAGNQQVLSESGLSSQYGTVDDALAGAAAGDMSVEDMQALMAALDLEPNSGPYKQEKTLQKHLAEDGAAAYAQIGGKAHQWGVSVSAPQIDTLQTLFQGATVKDGDSGVAAVGDAVRGFTSGTVLGSLAPAFSIPASLQSGKRLGSADGSGEIKNTGQYLLDQTGVIAGATKLIPTDDGSLYNTIAKSTGPAPAAYKYGDEESWAGDRARNTFNFLTGLKATDYTSDSSAAVAKSERQDAATALKAKATEDMTATDAAAFNKEAAASDTSSTKKAAAPALTAAQKASEKEFKDAQKKEKQAKEWPSYILKHSGLDGKYPTAAAALNAGKQGQLSTVAMKRLLRSMGESYNYKRDSTLVKHLQRYGDAALADPSNRFEHPDWAVYQK